MKKITLLCLLVFAIAIAQAQNYLISFAGTGASTTVDSVKVENITQCTSLNLGGGDTLHLFPTAGINELNTAPENAVNIYPNPMTGACTIDFEAIAQSITTIELFDMAGKRILYGQELLLKGNHSYRLSGLGNGIYILKIESDKYSYMAKIVSMNTTMVVPEIKYIETITSTDKKMVSNTGKRISLKNGKAIIGMQYITGDRLKLTGKSGNYSTILMLIPTQNQTDTFNFVKCTDADSNHYAVVQIGTQIWMAENLKTTKYRDGAGIPNITVDSLWQNDTTGAYCTYNNTTNTDTINTYGHLYNWFAVNNSINIAPAGWHVPTDSEWTALTDYLGGESGAGGKLKENCTTLWLSPNAGATNETGFTAFPGGMRYDDSMFNWIGTYDYWWSSSEYYPNYAWYRSMSYLNSDIYTYHYIESSGFSVRCVKD